MSPGTSLRVPRQLRAIRMRDGIVEAARAEFSLRGYAAATSRTIALRAGVSVGSLYQYFEGKDDVLREIARQRATVVAAGTVALLEAPAADGQSPRAGAKDRLRQVVLAVMAAHRDDPGLHAVLTERRHCDAELDAITSSFEGDLVRRTATLLGSWGHPGDCLATAFVLFSMIEGAVHSHVLGQPVVDDERLVDSLLAALVRVAFPSQPPPDED